ncbi:MAG: hypothetical protein HYV06_08975 [Deltaproteobacteria bacterium]|nr:hypothetical protein [Deltaproteobacteria bacterium]
MATTADLLDLSVLPASSRREVRDFYQFLLYRSGKTKKMKTQHAATYRFSDLCGKLSWKGDAVATQRKMRDEW